MELYVGMVDDVKLLHMGRTEQSVYLMSLGRNLYELVRRAI